MAQVRSVDAAPRDDKSSAQENFEEISHAAGEKVEAAAVATAQTVSGVSDRLSAAIAQRPVASMAIAASVGVGLAFLLSGNRQRHGGVTGAELREISHSIRDAVKSATPAKGISSLGDNLVTALNDTEAREALTDTANRAIQWWSSLMRR